MVCYFDKLTGRMHRKMFPADEPARSQRQRDMNALDVETFSRQFQYHFTRNLS